LVAEAFVRIFYKRISMARSARDIKVKKEELSNDRVAVQIGAMERRDSPNTIYISMGFWTKPISETPNARAVLHSEIIECYDRINDTCLSNDTMFPNKVNNIFIVNLPENFNYNEKRNYVNMELYLHTRNIRGAGIPLVAKKENELYASALKVAEAFVSSDLMTEQRGFEVRRSNR